MIIDNNILDEKIPIEMMPSRLDSAMNLYTYVHLKNDGFFEFGGKR